MKKTISILLTLCFSVCALSSCSAEKSYTTYFFDYFDTSTQITGFASDKAEFYSVCDIIEGMIAEYDRLFDIYDGYEGVNNLYALNSLVDGKHPELAVDTDIIGLLQFGKEAYGISGGKVNIAMGSVLSLWHEQRTLARTDPEKAALPDVSLLKEAALHADIDGIVIDADRGTVYLSDSAMTLDVGAIAKGYVLERIADGLESRGISGYLINLGGNVRTVGDKNGRSWTVGTDDNDGNSGYVKLKEGAISTSGDYLRYYTVDGVRYSHIIDPGTLMPATLYKSVRVITEDAALGDALSTALFCMEREAGLELVESTENAEAMWTTRSGETFMSGGYKTGR